RQNPGGTSTTRQQLLNDRQLVGRADARTMLESMGVAFPPGANATFWPHSGTLIVRNTQDSLDFVDALVDQANASQPKQVSIESKFIEINQNNLKELGFDWLLGPFSLNGKVFGAGGTAGNQAPVNAANFPFVDPATGKPIGQNPATSGNRSGNFAITANALDALLMPGLGQTAGMAPGIFGLAGVFTNPQFQVVIRALNQKKGIDLLSAPSVTTKSGQRAIIEVVREFRYPRTYTQPQVPSISSTTGTTLVGGVVPVVVTPTTPQDWETRNTGVTLEVEPVVGGDATTIDLNLIPQVVEFEGFINYGSPINAVGVQTVGAVLTTSVPIELTPNVINQPVFSTRKVTTSVSVYDGQTVVLGGLMREDVQKTEDKVPILGDIPLVGRAFRTNVEQHEKKNLVMFVTARIVTPAGVPLNEEEEGLVPPELPEVPAYKK
ncbi:MAG: type II and III secretion system protein, partial [Verrucomicrobia bacterium]